MEARNGTDINCEVLDSDASSRSSSSQSDNGNEDTWVDVEPDDEGLSFVSLFDDKAFPTIIEMFQHCKSSFGFDVWKVRQELALDFIGMVKMVNYMRKEVAAGRKPVHPLPREELQDDEYLKPTMEDDAVLFSLDDAFDLDTEQATSEVDVLKQELENLQSQFQAYREDVQKSLESRLDAHSKGIASNSSSGPTTMIAKTLDQRFDDDYFHSYSYNSIHETMLKDKIRTDAYRDFIYDNKDLFKDKIVLDVGCGTGILSMFCAKAGARMVIAVDNSDVIQKARQIIFDNGLQDTIKCIRGMIEEITLPVPKVDIIVSEWMGYCLLYESMFDSVIFARDKYLNPDGLMVPSHAAIRIAPLADSELVESYIDFWKDVYGFNMTAMLEKAHDDALIQVVDPKSVAGNGSTIIELDLHTTTITDLDFSRPFSCKISSEDTTLEGFTLWFDIFFLRSRKEHQSWDSMYAEVRKNRLTAFSTGPASPVTHWQQSVCLIKDTTLQIKFGEELDGKVTFQKKHDQKRALEIGIEWGHGKKTQSWLLG